MPVWRLKRTIAQAVSVGCHVFHLLLTGFEWRTWRATVAESAAL
jgi:hypothetical protein